MPVRRPIRRSLAALCAASAGGLAFLLPGAAPAAAQSMTTVSGTSFPDGAAGFASAGCVASGWGAGGATPKAKVRDIPGTPLGSRSVGFTTTPGTGAGPRATVDSVAATTVLTATTWSPSGSSGFVYVWLYPNAKDAWLGRAPISAAGSWGTVDGLARDLTWTKHSATTYAQRAGEPVVRSVAEQVSKVGDGPGHLGLAFGCDGNDFSLDSFRVGGGDGVRVFDFEGIRVSTSMSAEIKQRTGQIRLVGSSVDDAEANTGEPLVLEHRPVGDGEFTAVGGPILPGADGRVRAIAKPSEPTEYRWRRPDMPYADGGLSGVVLRGPEDRVPVGTVRRDRADRADRGDRTTEPTPTEPTEPTQPTEPSAPAPTEPTPTEPTPTEPTQPTEPTEPAPTEPTAPTQPTEPTKPGCDVVEDDASVAMTLDGQEAAPDGALDTDGDGVPDVDDECPTEPGDPVTGAPTAEQGVREESAEVVGGDTQD